MLTIPGDSPSGSLASAAPLAAPTAVSGAGRPAHPASKLLLRQYAAQATIYYIVSHASELRSRLCSQHIGPGMTGTAAHNQLTITVP